MALGNLPGDIFNELDPLPFATRSKLPNPKNEAQINLEEVRFHEQSQKDQEGQEEEWIQREAAKTKATKRAAQEAPRNNEEEKKALEHQAAKKRKTDFLLTQEE